MFGHPALRDNRMEYVNRPVTRVLMSAPCCQKQVEKCGVHCGWGSWQHHLGHLRRPNHQPQLRQREETA